MTRVWIALAALALIGFALLRGGFAGSGAAPLDAIDPASEAALERVLDAASPDTGAAPGTGPAQ